MRPARPGEGDECYARLSESHACACVCVYTRMCVRVSRCTQYALMYIHNTYILIGWGSNSEHVRDYFSVPL